MCRRSRCGLACAGGRGARFRLPPSAKWSRQLGFIQHANSLSARGYTMLNLRAGFGIDEQWRRFVDPRDATDRDCIASTGATPDARGRDGVYRLPSDGRRCAVSNVGLRLRLSANLRASMQGTAHRAALVACCRAAFSLAVAPLL